MPGLLAHAASLVAEQQPEAVRRVAPLGRWTGGIGPPEHDTGRVEERIELSPGSMKGRVVELSAHCATDDFRVPDVNGAGERDRGGDAKGGGGSDNRSDVSGVLDGVEDQES